MSNPSAKAEISEQTLSEIVSRPHLFLPDLISLMPGQIPDPGDNAHSYEVTSNHIQWRGKLLDVERAADAGFIGAQEIAAIDETQRTLTLKFPCTHGELIAWAKSTGGDFVLPDGYIDRILHKSPGQAPESLVAQLESWFNKPLDTLPDDLRRTVSEVFHGLWDTTTPEGRRKAALWWDCQHSAEAEENRDRFEKLLSEKWKLEGEIRDLELMAPQSPSELESRSRGLAEQRQIISEIERAMNMPANTGILTIEQAAEEIARKYGWHSGARDSLKDRLVEAARAGALTIRDPHTDLPYRPIKVRAYYDLVTIADIDAFLVSANVSYRLGSPPEKIPVEGISVQKSDGPLNDFRAMKILTADEVQLVFVAGDMIEVTARGVTRRVPWGALDLFNRRAGRLNKQGVILLGLAQGKRLQREERNSQAVTRLRRVFKDHFGISADPFHPYRDGAGWEPRFSVKDLRDAADQRAARRARHVPQPESDSDAAKEWLKRNAPDLLDYDE